MSTHVMNISDGVVAFYPKPTGGAALDLSTGALCVCEQVTNANIAASANSTDVPATFCSPASSRNVASSFSLNVDGIQDWDRNDGIDSFSQFLFKNDAQQVIAVLLPEEGGQVQAVAEVSVAAGDFLGAAGETLTFSGAFPVTGYPDIYDNAGTLVRGGTPGVDITGTVNCGGTPAPAPPTGATAGQPGTWDPAGSQVPADLQAANALGLTLGAAWATTGDYVEDASANHIYWDGSAFASGDVP